MEQLLNKLLREQHEKYTSLPPPHPTIATMGMTRKQRTAVTKPYNRSRIMKMSRVGKYKGIKVRLQPRNSNCEKFQKFHFQAKLSFLSENNKNDNLDELSDFHEFTLYMIFHEMAIFRETAKVI